MWFRAVESFKRLFHVMVVMFLRLGRGPEKWTRGSYLVFGCFTRASSSKIKVASLKHMVGFFLF